MKKLKIGFAIWVVFYNIVFFAYFVYIQKPIDTIVGLYPLTTLIYILILITIAVVNWILGWKIVNAPPKYPSKKEV